MTTLVLQSTRVDDDRPWIAACLDSVRAWARAIGADHRLLGDELFDPVPAPLRAKLAARPTALSDIARLHWMGRLLAGEVDRVVWVDADVLIFAPDHLSLPRTDHAVGREIWIARDDRGRWRTRRQVHNAILMAARGSAFLAFYRQVAMAKLADHIGPPVPQLVGPKLLSALHGAVGLPVIEAVGMASPAVMDELASGALGPVCRRLIAGHRAPLAGLNLCQSLIVPGADGKVDDAVRALKAGLLAVHNGAGR